MRSRNAGFAHRSSHFRMPAATADVLRRLEGAIERIFRVAPGCALYFVTKFLRCLNESSVAKESELIPLGAPAGEMIRRAVTAWCFIACVAFQ